jgi:hypothetical protein
LGTALLTRLTIAAICKIKIEITEEKKKRSIKNNNNKNRKKKITSKSISDVLLTSIDETVAQMSRVYGELSYKPCDYLLTMSF